MPFQLEYFAKDFDPDKCFARTFLKVDCHVLLITPCLLVDTSYRIRNKPRRATFLAVNESIIRYHFFSSITLPSWLPGIHGQENDSTTVSGTALSVSEPSSLQR
jgi:hypothetical protein